MGGNFNLQGCSIEPDMEIFSAVVAGLRGFLFSRSNDFSESVGGSWRTRLEGICLGVDAPGCFQKQYRGVVGIDLGLLG